MTQSPPIVHAFIDAQNVQQGISGQGWQYDLVKLRVYLSDKYGVTHAHFFIGQVAGNEGLYTAIQAAGFTIQYREVRNGANGQIKGNVDVNLTLQAVDSIDDYDQAILLSADGDFAPLVRYWRAKGKFRAIISPANIDRTSRLLKRDSNGRISYMCDIRHKLER